MEIVKNNRVDFAPERAFTIGGTRFIVTAHYDEKQEALPEKLAYLLKNDAKNSVRTLDKP